MHHEQYIYPLPVHHIWSGWHIITLCSFFFLHHNSIYFLAVAFPACALRFITNFKSFTHHSLFYDRVGSSSLLARSSLQGNSWPSTFLPSGLHHSGEHRHLQSLFPGFLFALRPKGQNWTGKKRFLNFCSLPGMISETIWNSVHWSHWTQTLWLILHSGSGK